jgi:hypothetical protein
MAAVGEQAPGKPESALRVVASDASDASFGDDEVLISAYCRNASTQWLFTLDNGASCNRQKTPSGRTPKVTIVCAKR